MLFFVKTQVSGDKVNELTQKIINKEIAPVKGNLVFLSPDGKIGYDIVEADSESEVRSKYQTYGNYLQIVEIAPIISAGEFYARFQAKGQGGMSTGMGGTGGIRY